MVDHAITTQMTMKGVEKEKEVEDEEEEEEEESKFEAAWIATLQTGNRTHCRR